MVVSFEVRIDIMPITPDGKPYLKKLAAEEETSKAQAVTCCGRFHSLGD